MVICHVTAWNQPRSLYLQRQEFKEKQKHSSIVAKTIWKTMEFDKVSKGFLSFVFDFGRLVVCNITLLHEINQDHHIYRSRKFKQKQKYAVQLLKLSGQGQPWNSVKLVKTSSLFLMFKIPAFFNIFSGMSLIYKFPAIFLQTPQAHLIKEIRHPG